ncbi:hypothetical protein U9M48_014182 [Paspalum notatum var. saurae]|uniref:non-specific serine/threonine protein kinase n=1 Tax=Paspalum notatum var. saurae TaxID=547442 RepID=A0AAQ3T137_PASNO
MACSTARPSPPSRILPPCAPLLVRRRRRALRRQPATTVVAIVVACSAARLPRAAIAGFLSIDCGLDDKDSGYKDPDTGIFYVSDGPYTDAGENLRVAPEYESWSQRRYHDGRNDSSSMEFDVHLGSNYWATMQVQGQVYEVLFVAWASWAPVCLLNTGHGAPFLSFLELRRQGDAMYPSLKANQTMSLFRRWDMGMDGSRYPGDPYDRYWWMYFDPQLSNLSTTQSIQPDPNFTEPVSVLQTAVTTTGNDTTLSCTWQLSGTTYSILHLADFQNTQTRQFDVYLNGDRLGSDKPYTPQYLASSSVFTSGWYKAADGNYNITLVATTVSVLPPILNAVEIYTLLAFDTPTTFPKDFDAIMAIKIEYGVKKNWMGDPCFPSKYAWEGVKCSNTSDNAVRIVSLDLSNSYLHGLISKNFTLLTALENLDLSYNNLSGPIPGSLPTLPSLRVLYDSDGCKPLSPLKNKGTLIAISIVVPVLVVVVLLLAYFIWREKRKPSVFVQPVSAHEPKRFTKDHGNHLPNIENRRFTYKELEKFTDNFKQVIGQGGFGLVYHGRVEDNSEVAVKIRSESSSHGLDEFLAEVQSLTKVHHRNLVSLIGYCWEKHHLALVYEYMSQGSLFYHLRGRNGAAETFNWGRRIRILLEAAQGLDYLHKGCSLPIIHRDVKTSNILLGHNFQAKIADFGLSKHFISDSQTHVSATGAGTTGYMDPECYLTGRITESCDVYSFGIVLLEVATGEPPIVPGQGLIIQRVKDKISIGDISSVADPRLGGSYDVNSMWKVVDIAMMCTSDSVAQRPPMASVVIQLKESLALEEARDDGTTRANSGSDPAGSVFTVSPLAR